MSQANSNRIFVFDFSFPVWAVTHAIQPVKIHDIGCLLATVASDSRCYCRDSLSLLQLFWKGRVGKYIAVRIISFDLRITFRYNLSGTYRADPKVSFHIIECQSGR